MRKTTITSTERMALIALALATTAGLLVGACRPAPSGATSAEPATWSVTAWGDLYEVFPESPTLVVGGSARVHVHVTVLDGFRPLDAGEVSLVLIDGAREQVFRATEPSRPGLFELRVEPTEAGELDLEIRVHSSAGSESIRGGRVRVGSADRAGGLVRVPAPRGSTDAGEPLPFLKEEQWRSAFGTRWVQTGRLATSVPGLAEVRPSPGGDAVLAAPVDGVLVRSTSRGWPYVGQQVRRGETLFELAPSVQAGESLAALEAQVSVLEGRQRTARERLARLEELLDVEAVSVREVEEQRADSARVDAQLGAAQRDLAAARAARGGASTAAGRVAVRAPFAGVVAEVEVRAGATIASGATLARVVRSDVAWLEVHVSPADAARLREDGVGGVVLAAAGAAPHRFEHGVRLVSLAPQVDPANGTVSALLELEGGVELPFGTHANAEVLLRTAREGVVVPASAVIDDGGVAVAYLQLTGERFARQTVDVIARQGELVLVGNLLPGQRLVHLGGEAIRRSSLMGSGQAHGHVH